MNKLLKWPGDVNNALKTIKTTIDKEGYEFITWKNSQTGVQFIAKSSTILKKYREKFEGSKEEISESEIVKLSNTGLTINEIKETSGGTIKEGFAGKEITKINLSKIDILEQVLYNKDFDCSILFND